MTKENILCIGCIRDIKNLKLNTAAVNNVWMSPFEQKLYAAKCDNCKHDNKKGAIKMTAPFP